MEPDCKGKHYLLCASHTFPGRFTAWCVHKKRTTNCSLSDVKRSSKEAAYWLKGFLAGNTPEPPRFVRASSEEFRAWERSALDFGKTGIWPRDP
jgi:hypothetical protein